MVAESYTTFAKWLDKADTSMKVLWLQRTPGAGEERNDFSNLRGYNN